MVTQNKRQASLLYNGTTEIQSLKWGAELAVEAAGHDSFRARKLPR
jgi:hypothetical protein